MENLKRLIGPAGPSEMMNVAKTIEEIRRFVRRGRGAGKTIGLVPTMGALHEGHLSLIDAARKACDLAVVSIFVNPTQFGPAEDLSRYPRTPEADLALCRRRGVDAVFMPSVEEIYPRTDMAEAGQSLTEVSVSKLSQTLCGRSRPGHFTGVCTVVAKLFNIVQPDKAFFGAKDFQQAAIIRRLTADLNFPVEIVLCPTVREGDGLAMSSRNAHLTPSQRKGAPALYGALRLAEQMIRESRPPAEAVISAMRQYLATHAPEGIVDYIQIVDPDSLADVVSTISRVLVALAVKLGSTRLIDNMVVDARPSIA